MFDVQCSMFNAKRNMILDTLDNLHKYVALNPRIQRVVDFIRENDLKAVPVGKVRIDTPEMRAKARELILKKFDAACRMFDLKDKIEAEAED